ncbi:MAG: hypothetical protein M4579_003690 [Chaenotheca gracillima]|nr:MAG: hypothetical protein M4579_003690 [Chaenotheca gracillima]
MEACKPKPQYRVKKKTEAAKTVTEASPSAPVPVGQEGARPQRGGGVTKWWKSEVYQLVLRELSLPPTSLQRQVKDRLILQDLVASCTNVVVVQIKTIFPTEATFKRFVCRHLPLQELYFGPAFPVTSARGFVPTEGETDIDVDLPDYGSIESKDPARNTDASAVDPRKHQMT